MSRRRALLLAGAIAVLPIIGGHTPAWSEPERVVLVNGSTLGYYNAQLGRLLDNTSSLFPCPNGSCGDPRIKPAGEPSLGPVAGILGNWLTSNPLPLDDNWSDLMVIPNIWGVNTETAIVYAVDGGTSGVQNVTAKIGVDNGFFMWVNGEYRYGALAPGHALDNEYTVELGNFGPGTTFLQFLREDHGVLTGWKIDVRGDKSAPVTVDCSGVVPSTTALWPPDRTMRAVSLSSAVDSNGTAVVPAITGVTQDEPVNDIGDGSTAPDAQLGPASNQVRLRAERSGGTDGRVYRIAFTATSTGASCSGAATVTVAHSQRPGRAAVDSAGAYNSLVA